MLNERIIKDLRASGLEPEDVRVRALSNAERAATTLPVSVAGYVIPYFNIDGEPLAFYRVKVFDHLPKYKQIKATQNHVYFPLGVKDLILKHKYCIITEGEKKAASAVKYGFPCIGLSGVDSWRNRTLIIPENAKFRQVPGKNNQVSIKLEDLDIEVEESDLAVGLQTLIDLSVDKGVTLLICFDSDAYDEGGFHAAKLQVQRAAATLGFELRFHGVEAMNIKQMFLAPPGASKPKVDSAQPLQISKIGLDDYLLKYGSESLEELIAVTKANRRGFPQHPNIIDYVTKKLQNAKLPRKLQQQLALSILTDLDTRGLRMRNSVMGNLFLFVYKTRQLMDVSLEQKFQDSMHTTEFSRYIFQTYGLAHSDSKVLNWLATYFNTEAPIGKVTPQHTISHEGDIIYHQLNDGQYVVVSPRVDECHVVDNGTNNVLFESGCVQALPGNEFEEEYRRQLERPLEPLWPKVTKELRLRDHNETAKFLSLLCYLSPWVQRWRGTQLPLEMCIGEAGSGKSSLYELRLTIQTGQPDLRNAPNDLRDWYASISNSGGMHVTDNLHAIDKTLKARLSDELCRLITEPRPHIEQRKLYTNNMLVKLPVNPIFAVTAIQQPFRNTDLIQRSMIFDFDKGEEVIGFVARWADQKLNEHGGRIVWLAHQLSVLHRFLKLVQTKWNPKFYSKHRLINFEQNLRLMHEVIFPSESHDWIGKFLENNMQENVQVADWAFEGLCAFAQYWKVHGGEAYFTASDIADWAQGDPDFKSNMQLTVPRTLGRYIQTHKQQLAVIAGIKEAGKYANVMRYTLAS